MRSLRNRAVSALSRTSVIDDHAASPVEVTVRYQSPVVLITQSRNVPSTLRACRLVCIRTRNEVRSITKKAAPAKAMTSPVSYTHLRAHETRHDLVCRL